MKIHMLIAVGAVSLGGLSLLAAPSAAAGDCCPHGCKRMGTAPAQESPGGPGGGPRYDPDTVTTVRGTVDSVSVVPARGGRGGGLHVSLKTEGAVMDVHLGPTWFLQRDGWELVKGDGVEVTGSVVDVDGATFLIARDVKKGPKALRLRDDQGIPAWSGGRRP